MSRPDPHIIGLCPSTSYLLQMYIKSRMNKQPEKKTTVFTKKICKFKTSYYLCNTKFQRWIHLRVRIRASHARHRGSNPLSTTRLPNGRTQVRPFPVSCFRLPSVCSLVWGGGIAVQDSWPGRANCRSRKPPVGNCRAGIWERRRFVAADEQPGRRLSKTSRQKVQDGMPPGGNRQQEPVSRSAPAANRRAENYRSRLMRGGCGFVLGYWLVGGVTFPVCL